MSKRKRRRAAIPGQHTDLITKGRIVGMHEAGLSNNEIVKKTKTSKHTVIKAIKDYTATGEFPNRHAGGRKRKLDKKERAKVIRKAKKKKTAQKIADEYAFKTGKTISERTVRRVIHEGGLVWMKKKKIQKLTAANLKKRLEYAEEMKNFEWKYVLFSDEKTFYLGTKDTMSWQDPKNRDEIEVEQYPKKLNVWGAIGHYFRTPLFFFEENLDAEQYQEILQQRLPPEFFEDCPKRRRGDWIFQQDGATPHRARDSRTLLDQIAPDRIKNHPPKSPDFNPMEDLWSHLDREIRKVNRIPDINRLKRELRKIWNNVPLKLIRASVSSMPRRLEQCVQRRGRRTDY
jgi:transposase